VVVHDHAIEAYLVLAEGAGVPAVEREITTRLAAYKRPRRLHIVEQLPRTATGKLVRNHAVLRGIGPGQASAPRHTAGQASDGDRPPRPG
jgi:acyl-coenzyme A synthetase/AMP-(fatty) acid ligase